jgi:hypothetical protein
MESKRIDVTDVKPIDAQPFSIPEGTYDLAKTNEDVVGRDDFPVLTGGPLGPKWLGINKVMGLILKQKANSLIIEENGRQFLSLPSPCLLVVTKKGAMSLTL